MVQFLHLGHFNFTLKHIHSELTKLTKGVDILSKWLNAVKEKKINVSNEMDALFKAHKDRMNSMDGWSEDIPVWLKKVNPDLYSEWTEAEYMIDERWGVDDLAGFKEALQKYEEINLKILKLWKEGN